MKRTTLLLAALAALALANAPALAQVALQGSIALNWDQCYGDGSIYNKAFACDTNAGFDEFVVSATPPADIPALVAATMVVDLEISSSSLTPWWNFDTGCRSFPSALSGSFVAPAVSACVDPWQGNASGGFNYISGFGGPDRGRIRSVCALPTPVAVFANHELFITRVRIAHTKTVGTAFCPGCMDPVCLMLSAVELDQNPGLGNITLVLPKPGTDSDLITWQGAAARRQIYINPCPPDYIVIACPSKEMSCPSVTPTRRPTWGAIKGFYR